MTAGRVIAGTTTDWCTPEKYVDAVRSFFGGTIALDPCSNASSIVKAEVEYQLPTDGLSESWDYPTIYVNPPYGADRERGTTIAHWLRRCAASNGEVLALVPVATNTRHWKESVFGTAAAVCFLADTRLKFIGASEKGAPMACAMVYWGSRLGEFVTEFTRHGTVMADA